MWKQNSALGRILYLSRIIYAREELRIFMSLLCYRTVWSVHSVVLTENATLETTLDTYQMLEAIIVLVFFSLFKNYYQDIPVISYHNFPLI